jgi:hypothetical protein
MGAELPRRGGSVGSLGASAWVEGVAQPVTQSVEAHHGEEDGEAGEEGDVRRVQKLEGGREAAHDLVDHRRPRTEGASEVTLESAAQEGDVLLVEGPIETELGPDSRHHVLGRVGPGNEADGIPGTTFMMAKARTETPTRTGMVWRSRRRTYQVMLSGCSAHRHMTARSRRKPAQPSQTG